MSGFLNRHETYINGIETEFFEAIGASSCNKSPVICIIPGNPGIALYYEAFAFQLNKITQGRYDIVVMNYLNFGRKPKSRIYSITEEAKHMENTLQCYRDRVIQRRTSKNKKQNPNFLLIGHSIGAFIGDLLMRSSLSAQITGCIHLFPFLALDLTSSHQRLLQRAFSVPLVRSFLPWSIGTLLPAFVKKRLLQTFAADLNLESQKVSELYFVELQHTIQSVVCLAHTEFETLDASMSAKQIAFYKENAFRLRFVYTSADHWAPIKYAELLKKELPRPQNIQILQVDIQHAFVCADDGIKNVAKILVRHIEQFAGREPVGRKSRDKMKFTKSLKSKVFLGKKRSSESLRQEKQVERKKSKM